MSVDMQRCMEKAQEALVRSQERAQESGNRQVEGLHLLAALREDPDRITTAILRLVNSTSDDVRRRVAQDIAVLPCMQGAASPPQLSNRF